MIDAHQGWVDEYIEYLQLADSIASFLFLFSFLLTIVWPILCLLILQVWRSASKETIRGAAQKAVAS